jgi:hypothetical protein
MNQRDQIKANILATYQHTALIKAIEGVDILKGKAAKVGEIRNYDGKPYQKQGDGKWTRVQGNKETSPKEEPKEKEDVSDTKRLTDLLDKSDNMWSKSLEKEILKTPSHEKRFKEIVKLWQSDDEEYGLVHTMAKEEKYRRRAFNQVIQEDREGKF